jgi:hypothetical protein
MDRRMDAVYLHGASGLLCVCGPSADAANLELLGLRSVTEGGKLWLHVPDDEGILTETQTCNNLTLVSDAPDLP